MTALPLIRGFGDGGVFARRKMATISVQEFLKTAGTLAARLPERRYMLNLCTDRYHFAVGLAAALLRRQTNLLPANLTPEFMRRLRASFPDTYCLVDGDSAPAEMDTVQFPIYDAGCDTNQVIPDVPDDHVAAVLFTSGSTGDPVPHAKTWRSLVTSALSEIERLDIGGFGNMTILGTVPPQHMYGFESTVLMPMQGGCAMHAGRPFYAADVCADLEQTPRARGLVTTPVHLRLLLAESTSLPAVDFMLSATAPLSPQLAAEAEQRFGAPLYEIYGCTEAGQVATRRTVTGAEWQALSGLKLRQDQQGTSVRGGHVEQDIGLADVIELSSEDRFVLHGRTADLVNIAGKRTSLAHLNYHLNSIPGVLDGTFVIPDQDDDRDVRLVAFVVAPGMDARTITNALRQCIDAAFLPRPLHVVDALPRSATGKLPKKDMNDLVTRMDRKTG